MKGRPQKMDDRTVRFESYEGADAARHLDTFLPTYTEVYAEPPYREGPRDIADFTDRFHVQARRPGFRLVLARGDVDIIGFTFGFLLPADTSWWKNLQTPAPEDFTREDGRRTFAVIELAVREPWRRQGVATGLHTTLLKDIPAERVTLTTRPEPEAAPAQAAYAHWGYRKIGVSHPWETAPYYDAMLLDLHPGR
ncbi:GNAT family N-acetyltransferase [Streptomyces sp. NPDC091292]|uniref:GNAT family N-acetyltransferase n=1 Tax=Streptomyces sp. NPDC091292 TaxID=3365991 RepID=UPI00382DD8FD